MINTTLNSRYTILANRLAMYEISIKNLFHFVCFTTFFLLTVEIFVFINY
ncbi:MAG: hypothetical protein H6Q20_1244 [Bacteroidetes bacterium]|jgi:hypothetical protein|nr:hypothetical protein [Bacteroidota bacterium]